MRKHILPLTYEPKIKYVRKGSCRQTIRPLNRNRMKNVGDYVMFHGWSDKPYRSKWNWRTPYWLITEVVIVQFWSDALISYPNHKDVSIEDHGMEFSGDDADNVAVMDWFRDYDEMYQWFLKSYGGSLDNKLFQVIRWNPKKSLTYRNGEEK